ncbi:hypothetical protein [Arenimonas sp.]|uniref:hypothetical protein n=1 Tax=Arenimonas sp. TaxID=1872635 RepID=UPI0025B8B961|nr:hypothetical protein [Arenimonas sp.]
MKRLPGVRGSGRPRTIHSRPLDGIGGRPLTQLELRKILKAARRFAHDVEARPLIEMVYAHYETYLVTEDALRKIVGVKKANRDIDAVREDCKIVARLLSEEKDLADGEACVYAAASLKERLINFPPMALTELTTLATALPFQHARWGLIRNVVFVAHWPKYRQELISAIGLIQEHCVYLEEDKHSFTKRKRLARDTFRWFYPDSADTFTKIHTGSKECPCPSASATALNTSTS